MRDGCAVLYHFEPHAAFRRKAHHLRAGVQWHGRCEKDRQHADRCKHLPWLHLPQIDAEVKSRQIIFWSLAD